LTIDRGGTPPLSCTPTGRPPTLISGIVSSDREVSMKKLAAVLGKMVGSEACRSG
jgi:hypothetical protein